MNEELQKYYQYLKSVKADVPPDFNSFATTLADETQARTYFDYLKANKFDAPDTFDSFSETLGLKKKPSSETPSVGETPIQPLNESSTQPQPSTSVEQPTPQDTQVKEEPTPVAKTLGEWVLGGVKAFDQSLASLAGSLDYVHTSASDVINQIILGKEDALTIKKMREEGVFDPVLNPVRPFQAIEDAINYAHSGAKPLPETIGGKVIGGAMGVVPIIVASLYAPELQLPSIFAKLGLKEASKFGLILGAEGAIQGAEKAETGGVVQRVGAPMLGAIEGYFTGSMFDGIGQTSAKIGKNIADKIIPKVVTQGQAINKALVGQGGSMLTNAIIFGGYGNAEEYLRTGTISAETFATNAGMGIALGLKEPGRLLYAKGLNAFIATPKEAINRMVADKTTPEEFAKEAQAKINAIENGDSPNREGDLAAAKMNANLASLNAIVDEIQSDKKGVIKSIQDSELEPKAKELIIDKINEVDADNDPKVQAIKPINEKIVKIDHALKDIADNKSWSDTMKEVESAPLKERRDELKQEAKEKAYGIKPKEETQATKDLKGAVEKPKAPQTEASKKLLDEIDKPIKLQEETDNAGREKKKNIGVTEEVIPEQKPGGAVVNGIRPDGKTGVEAVTGEEVTPFNESKIKDIVYHGTFEDFTEFKVLKDIGIHFGSKEQATERLNVKSKKEGDKKRRLIPVFLNIKNPLKIDDVGVFDDAYSLATELASKRVGVLSTKEYQSIKKELEVSDVEYKQKNDEVVKRLVNKIKESGYDGIEYDNYFEGKVKEKSYIVFDTNQIKEVTPAQSKENLPIESTEKPVEEWRTNLEAAQNYVEHLLDVDQIDALIKNGELDWYNLKSVVKQADEFMKESPQELPLQENTIENKPINPTPISTNSIELAKESSETDWYHGSKGGFDLSKEKIDPISYGDVGSLVGLGLYTTADPITAKKYAGQKGKVFKLNFKLDKIINGDTPISNEILDAYKKNFQDDSQVEWSEVINDVLKKDPNASLVQLHLGILEEAANAGISKESVMDRFQDLTSDLTGLGYDGITHEGGKTLNQKTRHRVLVLFDPEGLYSESRKNITTNKEEYKEFPQESTLTENKPKDETLPQGEGNVPPKPPIAENAPKEAENTGIHKIGLRALESIVLGDEIKTAVKEQGIEYAVRGKGVRAQEAEEFIKLYDEGGELDNLSNKVYDTDSAINFDTRTTLNVAIAKHLVNKLNESKDATERKTILDKLKQSIAFGQERATMYGQAVEAQKEWQEVLGTNPELSVHLKRARVEKEQAEMFKANEKEVEEGYKTLNDFLKSEEIVKIIDEKVSEEISKIGTKRFGATDKKKIDDFFEGLKVKTEGKLFDATIAIPITIYNGSIEVIKRSIMAGMDIANAVQAGIDNLDKWHKEKYEKDEITSPEWRKDDYRASLTEKLKPLVKSVSKIKVSDVPKAKYKTLVEKMYAKMPMASKQQLRMLVKNALEELATTGEISKEQFRNELARALGKPHITDAQEMDLFNAGMAMKNVRKKGEEVNKAFDEYEKENAKTNPDKVKIRELKKKVDGTIKEATKAIYNAQKTQKKTDEIFTDTPDWVDTFVTLIKGNLLTIPSLVVNLTSNIGAPLTRVPKNAIASSLDWMISGIAKTYEPIIKKIDPEKSPWLYRQASKLPGSQRTIDFIAYMRGAPRGFKRGIVKGAKQIVTGALPEELLAREINRSLHPIDAAIRLVDMTKGNVPTSVGKYVQAILEAGPWSYNAEFMFRMLNMGDKPFKEPHYIGRLEEIASLKGLTGVAKERFIEQPDEVSEADAKKTADIAVWQNDNAITKWLRDIEKATKHDKSKKDLKQAIMQSTVVRTLARLGLATNAPYVKTPTNIIKEGFEYAVPAYSLLRAAESAYNGNRRQALDFIGKAVVGTIVGSIAANLVSNGLISPPPSKDDKERAQQYDQDMPYMLNVTATIRHINGEDNKWREGDFKVSIKPYGIMSALLMAHVKAYSDVEPSKIKDMSYLDNMAKVVPSVVSSSLDQSFLAGTSVGLTAFIKGGPEMDKYLVSTSRALSSAVYPNNAAILSKTFFSKNFIRETKDLSVQGENVQKQIKNDFKDRMFMGKELPTKVSIWGQRVNRVPDGRNWPYMLFDVTKYEKQQETTFGTKIWGLYKDYKWLNKEDATKLLPSLPSISTEVGWEDRKMTPTEVEEFQMAVGQKRAIYAQHYVDSDQWEEDDNITRGETLTKLYNKARRESLAENFDWDETKKKYPKEWQDTYDLGVIPLPSMGKKFGDKKFSDEDVAMYNRIAADNYMKEIANRENEFKTKTDEGKIVLANGLWKKHIALAKKQVWEGAKASQVK